jgi:predicted heme/steroid binding protein
MSSLPIYTRSQLALRNGQEREEIWVAYEGVIYDVSHSRHWKNGAMPGIHYGHWAGQDLTDELPKAPHTESVFRRMQAVGRLEEVIK